MNIEKLYTIFNDECSSVASTDTRNLVPGSLFFALRGETYDGNTYAEEALKNGCNYAIVDNSEYVLNGRCILVSNSMQTLQDLAHHHRMKYEIPVLAITGSNGKTTTKELINSVLSTEKNVVATIGNLNNHVGVPLTLLAINDETNIAVIEMGANHVGEIAQLCEIAAPNYGLITNIGRAHLGFFGGFEGVVRAKTELFRYLEKMNGTSFVNGSDSLLLEKSNTEEKITYISEHSDYPVISLQSQPFVSLTWKDFEIQTQLTGEYNISNIAAAIAVGDYFAVSGKNIIDGIQNYEPKNERSEIIETENGNIIIKDYYNANRSSIECALENLAIIKIDKQKVVILGDIFELGEYEGEEHQSVVDTLAHYSFDLVYLVGNAFSKTNVRELEYKKFNTTDELIKYLRDKDFKNSYILLKASHGMNFKELFNENDW